MFLSCFLIHCIPTFPALIPLLLFLPSLLLLKKSISFVSMIRADFGRNPLQRGLLICQLFCFFVEVSAEAAFEGTAIFDDDGSCGENVFRYRLLDQKLPCNEESG